MDLIQFWWQGRFHRYITNVLDPHVLPLHEVAVLYSRRWDIEMAFRLLKDYLKGADIWSAKWPVIEGQLWALFLLAQILHAWQNTIAIQAGGDRFEASMELALRYLSGLCSEEWTPRPKSCVVDETWALFVPAPVGTFMAWLLIHDRSRRPHPRHVLRERNRPVMHLSNRGHTNIAKREPVLASMSLLIHNFLESMVSPFREICVDIILDSFYKIL